MPFSRILYILLILNNKYYSSCTVNSIYLFYAIGIFYFKASKINYIISDNLI